MRRLNEAQMTTVLAIADAIAGPLAEDKAKKVVEEHLEVLKSFSGGAELTQDEESLHEFLQVHPKELGVGSSIELLLHKLPLDKWSELEKVLYLLTTGWGTKLLTGAPRAVPFHELTLEEREISLRNLSLSSFAKVRSVFQAFKILVTFCMYSKCRTIHGKANPIWAPLEYEGKPTEYKRPHRAAFWEPTFEDVRSLADRGEPVVVETDVVIVGSGAGGGVAAAELAKAGHKVLVLEKATYYHPADATFNELQSFWDNFENSVLFPTEDLSMMLLAGSAWGGGTYINWSASLAPPQSLREEWATKYNLPFFISAAFQEAVDTVCKRAGVSTSQVKHNAPNQILLDGAAKLGFPAETVPQNTAEQEHSCGYCTLGCPYGQKQGTHVTWLKDAADAGAKFIDGCFVERITYDSNKQATGVVGTILQGTVKLIVKAKTVVSAGGSINTPALLLRSGLKNPNIGKNLRLHPVVTLHGFFPQKSVKSWKGSILTSVCNVVRNIHGSGYGARIEVPASLMGLVAAFMPWRSNADFHRLMLQFPRLASFIILARDLDSDASVAIDSEGRPRVSFDLGRKDAQSLVEGLIASAKILLSQGAIEINTTHHALPPLVLASPEDLANPIECATTQNWFKELRKLGVVQNSIGIVNAHQMGSCRMGATPATGAVNPDGESWEIQNLYVADASLFPTASGVNPMVTTFAVAYSVAQFIKANLSDKTNCGRKRFQVSSNFAFWTLFSSRQSVISFLAAVLFIWWRKRIWNTLWQKLLGYRRP